MHQTLEKRTEEEIDNLLDSSAPSPSHILEPSTAYLAV